MQQTIQLPAAAGMAVFLHRRQAVRTSPAAAAVVPCHVRSSRLRPRVRSSRGGTICMAAQPQLDQTTVEAVPVLRPVAPVSARSDIQDVQIADGVTLLRCRLADRLKLEIEYSLDRGSSDNCLLIKGESDTALISVPDDAFAAAFGAKLASTAPRDFKYIVLGHLSPKRAASLAAAISARSPSAPPVEIWCSNPAALTIQALLQPGMGGSEALQTAWGPAGAPRAAIRTVAAARDTLPLGGARALSFVRFATPRWPDALCIHDPVAELLFSSKFFSAHCCAPGLSPFDDGGFGSFGTDWRYYFDCMIAPIAKQAQSELQRLNLKVVPMGMPPVVSFESTAAADAAWIRGAFNRLRSVLPGGKAAAPAAAPPAPPPPTGPLAVSAICPMHGPIVRTGLSELLRDYRQWTDAQVSASSRASVAVIYASAYGNTSALAQAIARGATKAGVGVESLNCEFASADEVTELVRRSDGFVIGSPTLGGAMPTPVKAALGAILREAAAQRKPAGVFGSFGWSGEAVDELEQRLKDGGFTLTFPTIRCKFKPTEATLQACEESGTDLAQAVLKGKRATMREAARQAGGEESGRGTAQAVGRIVGSLCVLTAKKGDAESAMLASWVSQASFQPPALTVAVSKDRAVEGLVLPGAAFVLNVLAAGQERTAYKALAREFKPGEPRMGGLESKVSEVSGCAILPEVSTAYLECTVTDRMEAGDHWVVLARVDGGTVLNDKAITAVHHRKTGASY